MQLKAFVPEITTAETAAAWKDAKQKEKLLYPKGSRPSKLLPKTGVNISFSSTGLAAVSRGPGDLLQIYRTGANTLPLAGKIRL